MMTSAISLSICSGISLGPVAVEISKDWSTASTSLSVNLISFKPTSFESEMQLPVHL